MDNLFALGNFENNIKDIAVKKIPPDLLQSGIYIDRLTLDNFKKNLKSSIYYLEMVENEIAAIVKFSEGYIQKKKLDSSLVNNLINHYRKALELCDEFIRYHQAAEEEFEQTLKELKSIRSGYKGSGSD